MQSDGKILVTTGVAPPTELFGSPYLPTEEAGAIARYNTNGSLDTTFGISGQAACVASAAAVAIQSNGKIIVAGTIPSALMTIVSGGLTFASLQTGFGVVRYNANGSVRHYLQPWGWHRYWGRGHYRVWKLVPRWRGLRGCHPIQIGEIVVAGQAGIGNQQFSSSSFYWPATRPPATWTRISVQRYGDHNPEPGPTVIC